MDVTWACERQSTDCNSGDLYCAWSTGVLVNHSNWPLQAIVLFHFRQQEFLTSSKLKIFHIAAPIIRKCQETRRKVCNNILCAFSTNSTRSRALCKSWPTVMSDITETASFTHLKQLPRFWGPYLYQVHFRWTLVRWETFHTRQGFNFICSSHEQKERFMPGPCRKGLLSVYGTTVQKAVQEQAISQIVDYSWVIFQVSCG